jgi:hypothetical protein
VLVLHRPDLREETYDFSMTGSTICSGLHNENTSSIANEIHFFPTVSAHIIYLDRELFTLYDPCNFTERSLSQVKTLSQ